MFRCLPVSRPEADVHCAGAASEDAARVIGERLRAETAIPTRNHAFVPHSLLGIRNAYIPVTVGCLPQRVTPSCCPAPFAGTVLGRLAWRVVAETAKARCTGFPHQQQAYRNRPICT